MNPQSAEQAAELARIRYIRVEAMVERLRSIMSVLGYLPQFVDDRELMGHLIDAEDQALKRASKGTP